MTPIICVCGHGFAWHDTEAVCAYDHLGNPCDCPEYTPDSSRGG